MGHLAATCYYPFVPVPVKGDFVDCCHDGLQDWFWGRVGSDGGEDGVDVDAKRHNVSHVGDGSNACNPGANLCFVQVLHVHP